MAKVYEVAFQIGANMAASFAKTMKGAGGALGELNQQMAQMSRQQKANQQVIDLRNGVASAAKEFNAARDRVARLASELKKSDKPTKEMRREYEQAQQAVKRASDRLQQQRVRLREVSTQTGATGKSTAQLVAEQNRLAQSAERASRAQADLQKNVAAQQANIQRRGELRGQLFDAVALGASLAVPVKQAMDWEQRLAEFNKVAGKTQEEVNAIAMAAQEMAVATGVAREEVMGAYIAAAQAGFDESEWAKYAEVASKMGVAFDISGEAAGEMLKAWRSSMGLSMDEAEKLAAASNHIANNMNATAEAVGNVLLRQGAVMRSAGLSDTQSAALAAAMLSGGATDEVASTAAKNFLLALTKGSAATKTQQNALQMLGFHDPERLAKAMQKGPEQAIMLVLQRLQGLDAHSQTAVMTQLFGSESIGGIAPLIANLDNLAGAFALVNDESKYITSLEDEFEAMGSTTANQMNKARESIKVITTTIGAALLPTINQLMAQFAPMALSFAKFAQDNEWLVKALVMTAAALIAAKVAAITLGYAWTFVRGAYLAVQGMLLAGRTAWLLYTGAMVANTTTSKAAIVVSKAMTAAQWLFNAAMTANPIGLVVIAIAALIAAGIALYKNWDTVVEFFSSAWERIKSLFMSFHPLGWMMSGFSALTDWLGSFSLFDSGKALLQTMADGIKSAVSAPVEAVKGALGKVREMLPFSDAKVGPLSELTYSGMQVMETLARGIKTVATAPAAAVDGALGMVSGGLSAFADRASGGSAGVTGGGGMTFHITQQITVGSGDAFEQAKRGAAEGAQDLIRDVQRALAREERLSYG